jgi:hypothetical protein
METYLEANHDIDIAHLASIFVELDCEDVSEDRVDDNQDSEQHQQAYMHIQIAVLFSNETFGPLADEPVEHPEEQDEGQGHQLVHVESVAEHNAEQ